MRRWLALILLCGGIALTAKAALIPAKAALGQQLLQSAWSESLETGLPVKPWGWADFTPMAKITAPSLNKSAIALNQASGAAMAWGPGHVTGTAAPGGDGVTAFGGHRDTHMRFLAHLKPGDPVELETADGQRLRYIVTSGKVVDSRAWRFQPPGDGPDTLALTTCWPFDAQTAGPLRFVLYAERAEPQLAMN
ncbi:MAG: class GN sortase [Pikeienuella sp.]